MVDCPYIKVKVMADDISVQILSQTSENIQKLFDLSTRIDERVKAIRDKQDDLDERLTEIAKVHQEVMQKIAVLESKDGGTGMLSARLDECQKEVKLELVQLDKRLALVEGSTNTSQDRWNKIFTFAIQIIWVILAAYLLMKLGIQAPAVP
jgi:chromosome segregation ATPase